MHKNEPNNADPRHCHIKEPKTVYDAKQYCLGIVILSTFVLGFFVLRIFVTAPTGFQAFMEDNWGCLALFVIMGVVITEAKKRLRKAKEFEKNGITVQGMIVDKWEDTGCEGEVYTYVGYSFNYLDSLWAGKKNADSSPYNKLQIGDCVTIRFLPGDPSISKIEGMAKKASSHLLDGQMQG
ncbi:MAG: hypothetical protein HOO93_11630 [Methyloglobulus sp.]|nr:hypothetical protein [Methyloglobulus sp.]